MGQSHDGFEFLKGNFEGPKGYAVGWMTKSHHGKLYIDDEGWGPEASSIEYGYRVPFGAFTSSLARSTNRALSRISAPASSKRLNVQVPLRFRLP